MSKRQLSGHFQVAILKVRMELFERSELDVDLKVTPIEMIV